MKKRGIFILMVFLILLAANLLPVVFLSTPKKYGIVSVSIWILLLSGFMAWRLRHDQMLHTREKAYSESVGTRTYGDYDKWEALSDIRELVTRGTREIMYWLGFQTLLTFVLLLTGYYKTKNKRYLRAAGFFGFCLVCFVILEAMMGIVPAGGMPG
jgi:hypothetical protein